MVRAAVRPQQPSQQADLWLLLLLASQLAKDQQAHSLPQGPPLLTCLLLLEQRLQRCLLLLLEPDQLGPGWPPGGQR